MASKMTRQEYEAAQQEQASRQPVWKRFSKPGKPDKECYEAKPREGASKLRGAHRKGDTKGKWQDHKGSEAIDKWGLALRDAGLVDKE